MTDWIGIILLSIVAFLFYMTFYTLYGYKIEKDIMRRFREEAERVAKSLGLNFKVVKPNAVRIGRHYVIIEPAPRYNPITTRLMKRKGLLKEYIYVKTRLRVPKNVEMLFIPKRQKRLLTKYAGLVAQLKKIALIEGFVTAANDVKLMEKVVRRYPKVFSRLASLANYVRYVYLEGGELESSFELEVDELKMLGLLIELHSELCKVFEETLRDFSESLSRSRAFGPLASSISLEYRLVERYASYDFP